MASNFYVCTGIVAAACNRFLTTVVSDPHTTCVKCCGQKCDIYNKHDICTLWDEEQWQMLTESLFSSLVSPCQQFCHRLLHWNQWQGLLAWVWLKEHRASSYSIGACLAVVLQFYWSCCNQSLICRMADSFQFPLHH